MWDSSFQEALALLHFLELSFAPQGPGARPTSAYTPSLGRNRLHSQSPLGEKQGSKPEAVSKPALSLAVAAHGDSYTMLSPAGGNGEQCGPLSPQTCQATMGSPDERCPLCVSP